MIEILPTKVFDKEKIVLSLVENVVLYKTFILGEETIVVRTGIIDGDLYVDAVEYEKKKLVGAVSTFGLKGKVSNQAQQIFNESLKRLENPFCL